MDDDLRNLESVPESASKRELLAAGQAAIDWSARLANLVADLVPSGLVTDDAGSLGVVFLPSPPSTGGGGGGGSGTVTTVSIVTANGISGTVASPTTAPAITLTIGAGAITNAQLAGSIAYTKLVGSDIVVAESQVTNLTADLAAKAPLASPTFTGVPLGPTAAGGTNTTQLATTAFVLANVGSGAISSVFTRTGAIVATSGDYTVAQVTGAAPLASPTFTGTVILPAATVTLAMMANMATASLLGRNTAGTGVPEVLSASTTKTLLSLNNVENTALSTWAGSTSITTLGTVTTGSLDAARITTGTLATARLGTGTPGAGKYVDGAAGAWTTLPIPASPARVVYTSSPPAGMAVPVSDAVLTLGNTADGTNNTTALQALLDLNVGGGPLRVIVDGKYTVSALTVNSNTEIVGLPGCGFKRLSSTRIALLSNTTESFGVGSGATRTLGSFGNTDITLRGLTLNCNANNIPAYITAGQSDLRVVAVRMMGVDGVTMDGLTVLDVPCYGIHIANVRDVRVGGCRQFLTSIGVVGPDGRDGFHINGPADKVWIDNCSWMAADDTLALNANDGDRSVCLPTSGRGQFPYPGPITNVFVNNLHINNSMRGIRLLSSDQVIDNVVIRNVTGSAGSIALLVSGFLPGGVEGGNNPQPGAGLVGNVTIDGLDVLMPDNGASWTSPVYLGCNFANLKIHGLRFRPDANNTRMSMHITSNVTYNTLDIDVNVLDLDPTNRPRTILQDDGVGDLVRMSGSLQRPNLSAVAFPAFYKNGGTLNLLRTDLAWDRSTNTALVLAGSITTVQMSGAHTNALGNGALNIGSGLTVTNFGHTDLLAAVAKDGPGTVTHDIGSGTYTDPDSRKVGLLASYRMADANGTALLDSSINVRSGTASGSISHTTGIAGFATCALADGTNFYTVSNASNVFTPGSSGYTVTGWVNFANVTTVQIIAGINDNAGIPGFLLYLTTDGKLNWNVGKNFSSQGPLAVSAALTVSTTYFFRADFNGTDTVNLRINEGSPVTTVLLANTFPTAVNLCVFADLRTPTAFQLGSGAKLDRLRFWSRQLTSGEGAAEYGSGTGNDWE